MSNEQAKIVLGFVGELSSGKGTCAAYIKNKFDAPVYRFSTFLREAMKPVYLEETRANMVKMSEIMRQAFGNDLLSIAMKKRVEETNSKIIVIDGIRRTDDIKYLSSIPGFHLVEVFADPKLRFERIKLRKENPDDATKTWEQFLKDADLPTELTIKQVAQNAELRVDNNGNFDDLHKRLDDIVNSLI